MERYEKYKDSGVQWLGEIPSHWELKRLKTLCQMFGRIGFRGYSREDLVDDGENGAITLSPTNFNEGKLDFTKCTYLSWKKYYESPEIMVNNGDIVFVKTASIGKCAVAGNLPKETTVNPQIIVFKNIYCNSFFLNYYLQNTAIQGWIVASANGSTISTISQGTIGNYPITIPPVEEQNAMVAYLDSVIAKIDEAIAQQQKMIDLLNERKQIIIQNAVTKGLDPDVKMKDSGVEWIGAIPEGWDVLPFKRVSEIILGKMLKNGPESKSYPYFCARDVHMLSINYDDLKKMVFSPVERKMYAVKRGDMLVVEGGASGSSAIVKRDIKDVYIQNSIMIVRGRENVVINDYMCYFLNAIVDRGYSECVCNKATIMHFTKDKLSNTLLPIPPIKEQSAIISYLDDESGKFDTAIETCQKKIGLLRERKQIIINDVVTGKVKVS